MAPVTQRRKRLEYRSVISVIVITSPFVAWTFWVTDQFVQLSDLYQDAIEELNNQTRVQNELIIDS
jgi:hypothetical protein